MLAATERASDEVRRRVPRPRDRARPLADDPAPRTRPWTHHGGLRRADAPIVRHGLDELLAGAVELLHGPGCPVCVTPLEPIDRGHRDRRAARRDRLLLRRHAARAGDARRSVQARAARRRRARRLLAARRRRARAPQPRQDGRVLRRRVRDHAPGERDGGRAARELGVDELLLLVSHVLVPPALARDPAAPGNRVQAFLAAGHVCTVMGFASTSRSRATFRRADRRDRLRAARHPGRRPMPVVQLEAGRAEVENQYVRAVRREGNVAGAARRRGGVRDLRPRVARHRRDPAERARAARRVRATFDAERAVPAR